MTDQKHIEAAAAAYYQDRHPSELWELESEREKARHRKRAAFIVAAYKSSERAALAGDDALVEAIRAKWNDLAPTMTDDYEAVMALVSLVRQADAGDAEIGRMYRGLRKGPPCSHPDFVDMGYADGWAELDALCDKMEAARRSAEGEA